MACNQWTCPHCGPIKKNRIADRVRNGYERDLDITPTAGHRVRAVTLTQKLGTEQYIMAAWSKMRHLLRRAGFHLKYFWAKEFTKNGERHLHLLVNAYIPQHVLKELWTQATNGESYIVWITGKEQPDNSEGDIHNPAGYATKYLTKAYGTEVRFDEKEHRYGFSRHAPFKAAPRGNIGNLTPIEVMERACVGSPWIADISQRAMITAWGLSPPYPQEKRP